jgi:hypothetical protein
MSESAGLVFTPSETVTRPADVTAYASGDLVANSTVAGTVTPMSFKVARDAKRGVVVPRCRISKSGTNVTNAAFRLHLYAESSTPANGDNGAFSTNKAGKYLGYLDVASMQAFSDGAAGIGVPGQGSAMLMQPVAGSLVLYGLLEARGAYTPASAEVFTVTLEAIQD